MRIGISTVLYPPAVGGAPSYIESMTIPLYQRGHEVTVFTSTLSNHTLRKVIPTRIAKETKDGVKISRDRAVYLPGIRGYPIVPGMLRMVTSRLDIMHTHSFRYWPADISFLAAKLKHVPLVFNPYYYPPNSPKQKAYDSTVGLITSQADVVVVISRFEQQLMEHHGVPVKRFELIPPGINLAEFEKSVDSNIFERAGIDLSQKRVVLFVGRLAPEKGIHTLLMAAERVAQKEPETVFLLIGPDFGCHEYLASVADSLGIRDRIFFTGEVSRNDLLAAYQSATVFAFPTRYEAFGIVMAEAMAAGLPVVASNVAAVPEVIQDGTNGLLFPIDDACQLADHLIQLLRNNSLRESLAKEGRRIVAAKYEIQAQISHLEELYSSLL